MKIVSDKKLKSDAIEREREREKERERCKWAQLFRGTPRGNGGSQSENGENDSQNPTIETGGVRENGETRRALKWRRKDGLKAGRRFGPVQSLEGVRDTHTGSSREWEE
jgi:hypothetical protein